MLTQSHLTLVFLVLGYHLANQKRHQTDEKCIIGQILFIFFFGRQRINSMIIIYSILGHFSSGTQPNYTPSSTVGPFHYSRRTNLLLTNVGEQGCSENPCNAPFTKDCSMRAANFYYC